MVPLSSGPGPIESDASPRPASFPKARQLPAATPTPFQRKTHHTSVSVSREDAVWPPAPTMLVPGPAQVRPVRLWPGQDQAVSDDMGSPSSPPCRSLARCSLRGASSLPLRHATSNGVDKRPPGHCIRWQIQTAIASRSGASLCFLLFLNPRPLHDPSLPLVLFPRLLSARPDCVPRMVEHISPRRNYYCQANPSP